MARRYSVRRGKYRATASKRGLGFSMGKFGLKLSPTMLLGAIVGFTNLDDKIPKHVTLAAAIAPVSGLGPIQSVAKGILIGNLAQTITGRSGTGSLSGGFKGI